jgi:hypothetical protein
MDANDLMNQVADIWAVQLDGTVLDDSGTEMDLDAVEATAKEMAEQASVILKRIELARKMVALTKAE